MIKLFIKKMKLENITPELVGFSIYKTIYQTIFLKKTSLNKVLFIIGCQRSGTSLMTRIFFRDLRVKVYRESSILSSKDPFKLRLNPLPSVQEIISKDKASIIVLKPLVESQNILSLLDFFPNSYAVWLFRDFKDVASSNIKLFGVSNGINDLKQIVRNVPNDWRSEGVTPCTRSKIQKFFHQGLKPIEAAALFWFARNQLFFDLNLDKNPKIMMCHYENLVKSPKFGINHIYFSLGLEPPKKESTKEVHPFSVKKGWDISLSQEIEELCSDLLKRLEKSYLEKMGKKIILL